MYPKNYVITGQARWEDEPNAVLPQVKGSAGGH